MLWLSLRTGFGNTAFIAVLGLLPLVSVIQVSDPVEHARVERAAVELDQNHPTTPVRLASGFERGAD